MTITKLPRIQIAKESADLSSHQLNGTTDRAQVKKKKAGLKPVAAQPSNTVCTPTRCVELNIFKLIQCPANKTQN